MSKNKNERRKEKKERIDLKKAAKATGMSVEELMIAKAEAEARRQADKEAEEQRQEQTRLQAEAELAAKKQEEARIQAVNVEEEEFFEFVKNHTNNFEGLLEPEYYDVLFADARGRRGRIPKVPDTEQAHRFYDRMIKMIETLNFKRGNLDERKFLEIYSKSNTDVRNANAKTVKRIIDARLARINNRANIDFTDFDDSGNR